MAWMGHSAIFLFFNGSEKALFRVENCRTGLDAFFRWCSMRRRLILAWFNERQSERSRKNVGKGVWRVEKVKRCKKKNAGIIWDGIRRHVRFRGGSHFTYGHCQRANLHKCRDKDILFFYFLWRLIFKAFSLSESMWSSIIKYSF